MVTPANVERFLSVHRRWSALTGQPLKWDVWELWLCSGRTSLKSYNRCLRTGFPVDMRYGWDLRRKDHQEKLDKVYWTFTPEIDLGAPDCRLFSRAARSPDLKKREVGRARDRPGLLWLFKHCLRPS